MSVRKTCLCIFSEDPAFENKFNLICMKSAAICIEQKDLSKKCVIKLETKHVAEWFVGNIDFCGVFGETFKEFSRRIDREKRIENKARAVCYLDDKYPVEIIIAYPCFLKYFFVFLKTEKGIISTRTRKVSFVSSVNSVLQTLVVAKKIAKRRQAIIRYETFDSSKKWLLIERGFFLNDFFIPWVRREVNSISRIVEYRNSGYMTDFFMELDRERIRPLDCTSEYAVTSDQDIVVRFTMFSY